MKVKCRDIKNDMYYIDVDKRYLTSCRVCGYDFIDWYPWGESGCESSDDLCPCCFVQFGYEDSGIEAIKNYRAEWISKGCPWAEPEKKPEDWSLKKALANVPDIFK